MSSRWLEVLSCSGATLTAAQAANDRLVSEKAELTREKQASTCVLPMPRATVFSCN